MAETILVVDDQPTNRVLLTECLDMMGYETCAASNAEEGLHRLYEHKPDLVVTDLWMPGMDGFEFCRLVRLSCDVLIMMLTALGPRNESTFEPHLVDAYVEKPVGIDEFGAHIKALLRQPQVRSTSNPWLK